MIVEHHGGVGRARLPHQQLVGPAEPKGWQGRQVITRGHHTGQSQPLQGELVGGVTGRQRQHRNVDQLAVAGPCPS